MSSSQPYICVSSRTKRRFIVRLSGLRAVSGYCQPQSLAPCMAHVCLRMLLPLNISFILGRSFSFILERSFIHSWTEFHSFLNGVRVLLDGTLEGSGRSISWTDMLKSKTISLGGRSADIHTAQPLDHNAALSLVRARCRALAAFYRNPVVFLL
jgi:hypothetical protein